MKKCSKCQEFKELDAFSKRKMSPDGLQHRCKLCRRMQDIFYENTENGRLRRSAANKKYMCKPEAKARHRDRVRNRRSKDLLFRLSGNVRNRLNSFLFKSTFSKRSNTIAYLGCTFEQLKEHVEGQFRPGMSWENYGFGSNKWNIDHKTPLSSAKSERELYKLCHYSNLQPLWQMENFSKSNKMPELNLNESEFFSKVG